ncbi:hypothetical protein [Moraxella sp. VT-16-12]|uniref:hypothetical protein n=1 Tax=Moraxella sp. VT-16-12 TaxID=2014877 RepID=UPI000B801D0E|nr:hypothetical protein [Moraxella sp. VT-16-12]TWV82038.1 hypothetical protein CEW93_007090 [Moraxella sp. VT-16-12]
MNYYKQILVLLACTLTATTVLAKTTDTVVYEFTAFGDKGVYEDGWRAVVKKRHMSLEFIQNNEYHPKIRTKRLAYAKGVELTGKTKTGEVVTLNIRGQTCIDGQGRQHEFTATLYYKNKIIKGCAVRGAYGYAPT